MKKYIHIFCYFLIFCLVPGASQVGAQSDVQPEIDQGTTVGAKADTVPPPAQVLSWRACLELAWKNNPEIKISAQNLRSAEAKVGQALSLYFPQLGIEAGYNILDADRVSQIKIPPEYHKLFVSTLTFLDLKRDIEEGKLLPIYPPGTDPYYIIVNDPDTALPYYLTAYGTIPRKIESGYLGGHNVGATVSLTQPLFTGGKISGRNKQAVWNRDIKRLAREETTQKVLAEVSRTYFSVSHGQQLMALALEMQGRFEMLSIITKAFMEDEQSTKNQFDYLTMETYLKKIEHLLSQAENQVHNGKLYLQFLTGVPQAVEIESNTKVPKAKVQDFTTSFESLKNSNYSWQQLGLGMKIAEQEVKIAQAEYFPLIGLSGEYLIFHEEPNYGYLPPTSWQVTFGAKWKFPLGLQTVEAVKEKEAESQAAALKVQYAQQGMELKLKSLLSEIAKFRKQMALLANGVETARKRAQLAIKGYRIDVVGSGDLVKAQVEETEMRVDYLEVILDYQTHLIDYYILVGRNIDELLF